MDPLQASSRIPAKDQPQTPRLTGTRLIGIFEGIRIANSSSEDIRAILAPLRHEVFSSPEISPEHKTVYGMVLADTALSLRDYELTEEVALNALRFVGGAGVVEPAKRKITLLGLYALAVLSQNERASQALHDLMVSADEQYRAIEESGECDSATALFALGRASIALRFFLQLGGATRLEESAEPRSAPDVFLESARKWVDSVYRVDEIPPSAITLLARTTRGLGAALIPSGDLAGGRNMLLRAYSLCESGAQVDAEWFAELLASLAIAQFMTREVDESLAMLNYLFSDELLGEQLSPQSQAAQLLLRGVALVLSGSEEFAIKDAKQAYALVTTGLSVDAFRHALQTTVGVALTTFPLNEFPDEFEKIRKFSEKCVEEIPIDWDEDQHEPDQDDDDGDDSFPTGYGNGDS